MERFERKELKYRVPNEVMEPLRERLLQHMAYDPFCVDKEQNRYEVRSVYLDSSRLLFYWEKQDGLKIRKKLRIRGYG